MMVTLLSQLSSVAGACLLSLGDTNKMFSAIFGMMLIRSSESSVTIQVCVYMQILYLILQILLPDSIQYSIHQSINC